VFNDVISDVSYAGCGMRGEILGAERRRFWHDDDKLEIVMSVNVPAEFSAALNQNFTDQISKAP
jgi:hypothetical protein